MDTVLITELLREGVWVVIKLCAPMLLLSMLVGVLLAIFQAVTQIHEQTLLDYARRLFGLMLG